MRPIVVFALVLVACTGEPAPPTTAADARSELAPLDAADVTSELAPLVCPRGFEFDRCAAVTGITPCCVVDSRTTLPLGCGCRLSAFECVPHGRAECP